MVEFDGDRKKRGMLVLEESEMGNRVIGRDRVGRVRDTVRRKNEVGWGKREGMKVGDENRKTASDI